MFDFDHIEAWGPGLRRELSVAVPGDVSQAIASGKPKLVEDARDILLTKVDQTVVLRLVVNWLKLQTICSPRHCVPPQGAWQSDDRRYWQCAGVRMVWRPSPSDVPDPLGGDNAFRDQVSIHNST